MVKHFLSFNSTNHDSFRNLIRKIFLKEVQLTQRVNPPGLPGLGSMRKINMDAQVCGDSEKFDP